MPVTNHEATGRLSSPPRDPADVLEEGTGLLAALATRAVYEEQPGLWRFGEAGRARTQEDFVHHFRALATMDQVVFEAHVRYCEGLFSARGYPRTWLQDAWRHMAAVVAAELPQAAATPVMQLLVSVVGNPHAGGEVAGGSDSARVSE
jgi:hypothetical protein